RRELGPAIRHGAASVARRRLRGRLRLGRVPRHLAGLAAPAVEVAVPEAAVTRKSKPPSKGKKSRKKTQTPAAGAPATRDSDPAVSRDSDPAVSRDSDPTVKPAVSLESAPTVAPIPIGNTQPVETAAIVATTTETES